MSLSQEDIEKYFTRKDGTYLCARWGRPIAPVIFGVDEASLEVFKAALEAVVVLADHKMAETDPELGSNLMIFFCKDWDELAAVPHLDKLVPDLQILVKRLIKSDANQYRIFRFEEDGAIKAAFVFLRLDEHMANATADTIALSQATQTILLWSDTAFMDASPLGIVEDKAVLKPEIADIIRTAYDPTLPAVAQDKSHALRMAARLMVRQ
ncbi:hypothetical protein SAMN05444003_1348 [Cognatiyoonia sediminum]|uniref:Uncharacterized protein n=1 Tax=Cognatiyoonia sediminum TaxID=1508389 RepID=A0A1M5NDE5_9RHOB|nr:hypothetical protein [Cognatiyoonia sediminum]SHG87584.1 hypothetical protein SAMN05444003_1348 [Cognatiyoonia sediminum]